MLLQTQNQTGKAFMMIIDEITDITKLKIKNRWQWWYLPVYQGLKNATM